MTPHPRIPAFVLGGAGGRAVSASSDARWLYSSPSWLAHNLRRVLAWLRWNLALVCQMDADRDPAIYHDYSDSAEAEPMHFYTYTCVRCGKRFSI